MKGDVGQLSKWVFLIIIPFGFLGPRGGWREARPWLRIDPHGFLHVASSGAFDQTCQNGDVGTKRVFGPVVGTCYLGIC